MVSLSALYLGTDSSQELVDPEFCMMSAVAADCKQLQVFVEEFSTVSFPFFFDHLVRLRDIYATEVLTAFSQARSIEKKESAPIRKLLVDVHAIHQQLERLQADFGRLHRRALHEQSRFIFRYCRPFELTTMKDSVLQRKTSGFFLKRFPSLESDFDPSCNAEAPKPAALPIIGGYDADDVAQVHSADEGDTKGDEGTEAQAPIASDNDFSVKLGHLCRLIFLISGKDSYEIFVEHCLRAIVMPILNAIRQIREHVELCEEGSTTVSIDTHQLHNEVHIYIMIS